MKTGFDWQSDNDKEWSEEAERAGHRPRRRLPRRLRLLLILACVVGLVAGAGYAVLWRRAEARDEAAKLDVLAAHRTWERALAGKDIELLTSLIARNDPQWFNAQKQLLLAGRTHDRSSLGLSLLPGDDAAEVELSPDGTRALLLEEMQYRAVEGSAEAEAVSLRHISYYRLDGNAWIQTPPDVAFWGDVRTERLGPLTITYPSRDAEWVWRIGQDLQADLQALCAELADTGETNPETCQARSRLSLIFDTDPATLIQLSSFEKPAFRGRAFLLPAPSLAGAPVDETAYAALYRGYSRRILDTIRTGLALPTPLPDQSFQALCFDTGEQRLSLFEYDPKSDQWDEQATQLPYYYQFLESLPNDQGLLLRAGPPGVDLDRLQLILKQDVGERLLLDTSDEPAPVRLIGFNGRPQRADLMMRFNASDLDGTDYRLLPIESCSESRCGLLELPGFPIWSPDGKRTLVSRGADLYLGNGLAGSLQFLERGFSPFWLTDETFGYVRFTDGSGGAGTNAEIVIQSLGERKRRILGDSHSLPEALGIPGNRTMRIFYVTASPTDPALIFAAGSPVGGQTEDYYVFSLRLGGDLTLPATAAYVSEVRELMHLDGAPVGDPRLLTPTGYPPFTLSSDSRWLLASRFIERATNSWEIYLHDVERGETQTLTVNHPPYPAKFPFFDWSGDGKWLLLVDNGFFRLVAPEYRYERVITHDFDRCRYSGWVNAPSINASVAGGLP